ncbi:hypothetical protein RF11_04866 [Thelohanellus kitauei]|uniref:Uncharacterized protein n=1 Tax=Thelohanellus kitauei TaxID=669202 RepID=A0A0C2MDB4_THEKT|nr:hypothetical protein RF11_04866 [Thelohanellus kitauei]
MCLFCFCGVVFAPFDQSFPESEYLLLIMCFSTLANAQLEVLEQLINEMEIIPDLGNVTSPAYSYGIVYHRMDVLRHYFSKYITGFASNIVKEDDQYRYS